MNTTQTPAPALTNARNIVAGNSVKMGGVWFTVYATATDAVTERITWTLLDGRDMETHERDMAHGNMTVLALIG